jgi:hypothetical protein
MPPSERASLSEASRETDGASTVRLGDEKRAACDTSQAMRTTSCPRLETLGRLVFSDGDVNTATSDICIQPS